jgi:hypothetical protein
MSLKLDSDLEQMKRVSNLRRSLSEQFTLENSLRVRCKKEESMQALQAFQTVARERGFIEVNEIVGGNVLWLRKDTPHTCRETHQRMCIDSLTNSVTVYWMTVPGKLNSKTFRGIAALQEWFELEPLIVMER